MSRWMWIVPGVMLAAGVGCGSAGADSEKQPSETQGKVLQGIAREVAKSAWSGTITIKQAADRSEDKDDKVCCKSTAKNSLAQTVTITVTKGTAVAKIDYALKERVDSEQRYDYHKVVGYNTNETTASGTAKATVSVDLYDDGR